MAFRVPLADLAAIVITPAITNNNRLAWVEGRLIALIILSRPTVDDPWSLLDGADLLEFARTNNWPDIVADD